MDSFYKWLKAMSNHKERVGKRAYYHILAFRGEIAKANEMEDQVKQDIHNALPKMQSMITDLKRIKSIGDKAWYDHNMSSLWSEFAKYKGLQKIWYETLDGKKTDDVIDPEVRIMIVTKLEKSLSEATPKPVNVE